VIKLNKIKSNIILIFSVFIIVLLTELALNKIGINSVNKSYINLTEELEPSLKYLNKLESLNTELLLLTKYKLKVNANIEASNRIKSIIEVDYPNIKTEFFLLSSRISNGDEKKILFTQLSHQIEESIRIIKHFNLLLIYSNNIQDLTKLKRAEKLVKNDLTRVSFNIKNKIFELIDRYNSTYLKERTTLINQLNFASIVSLVSGIIAIFFAMFIGYRLIRSIVFPIQKLHVAANKISTGDYIQVNIKGNNELTSLGKSFNKMSSSLEASFKRLEENNREMEQFVYITTHDLQEPLRTILNFSDLLLKKDLSSLDLRTQKLLRFIGKSAERMSNLVNALLEYGKSGRNLKLELIDLMELITEVKEDLRFKIEENKVELKINSLPVVNCYKNELRVLFQNLIENSIKYKSEKVPKIEVSFVENNFNYEFKISDNGIGIKEDYYERIFKMFQRLHSEDEIVGTGIGLAKCKKISFLHNGSIWVKSVEGKGTDFFFTISKSIVNPYES
jgi:light-regulated signal transduction histidine kinase (bacteriophytochrome)